jgi:hypothetical protein
VTERWPTVEERRLALRRMAAAAGVRPDAVLVQVDRLLAGLLREWHLAIALTLMALGSTLTWEGVAGSIETLAALAEGSAAPAVGRLLAILDNALTTATLAALRLAEPLSAGLATGMFYRLPDDEVVMACAMGRGWWRLLGRRGDYLVGPDGAIARAATPPARGRPGRERAPTDWLIQDLCPATEAEFCARG